MKRSLTLLSLLLLLLLAACRRDGLTADQRACRSAAGQCYQLLRDGRAEAFVDNLARADQFSPEYRAQLVDLISEHAAALRRTRGGITDIQVTGDSIADGSAQVFLQLTFGDQTTEEVGLPMVRVGGEWLMQ